MPRIHLPPTGSQYDGVQFSISFTYMLPLVAAYWLALLALLSIAVRGTDGVAGAMHYTWMAFALVGNQYFFPSLRLPDHVAWRWTEPNSLGRIWGSFVVFVYGGVLWRFLGSQVVSLGRWSLGWDVGDAYMITAIVLAGCEVWLFGSKLWNLREDAEKGKVILVFPDDYESQDGDGEEEEGWLERPGDGKSCTFGFSSGYLTPVRNQRPWRKP